MTIKTGLGTCLLRRMLQLASRRRYVDVMKIDWFETPLGKWNVGGLGYLEECQK